MSQDSGRPTATTCEGNRGAKSATAGPIRCGCGAARERSPGLPAVVQCLTPKGTGASAPVAFEGSWRHPESMSEPLDPRKVEAQADERVRQILAAAASWAKELPPPLAPAVRAVCIRLGEMVADQRHYLAPLPEPQESERSAVLTLLAQRLASTAVSSGLEKELLTLSEMELKSTGSWALVPGAQAEWITTAIRYLESASERLPP